MQDDLRLICERAASEGRKIDLTGCNYGETTGPLPFIKRPTNYYYFLAGFVNSMRMKSILEIGTHFGGAIMSMKRGLRPEDTPGGKLVTVDIVCKNSDGFREYPDIKRITGDSLNADVTERVCEYLNGSVDLIYIDSLHEYRHTQKNIDIYAGRLNPRYIALDDIRQCDSMARLWKDLLAEFKENAFDASSISVRKGAGFGIIKWRKT